MAKGRRMLLPTELAEGEELGTTLSEFVAAISPERFALAAAR